MAVERVYLIRHGQTAWNAEGRWQGFEAVPLNRLGDAQAQALAAAWTAPLSSIHTSDLLRARQTAEILGQTLGLPVHTDERLRELNLGVFQGLTFEEIKQRYPAEVEAMRADYMNYAVPSGESRRALQARAAAALEDILAREPGPGTALVSHGGTLKVLLFRLFGETPELRGLRMDNTAVTTLERQNGRWRLVELASTAHLNGLAAATGVERRQPSEQTRPD